MSTDAPDYPPVTCHQCADLMFARKIAAQIRDGRGDRINSNLKFRHLRDEDRIAYAEYALDPKGYAERHRDVPFAARERAPAPSYTPMPYRWSVEDAYVPPPGLERRRAPGVTGRFGERVTQCRIDDCDIGDYIAERHMPEAITIGASTNGIRYARFIRPRHLVSADFHASGQQRPSPSVMNDIEERMFERVAVYYNDATHFFWKRTS